MLPEYNDTVFTVDRSYSLIDNAYGFAFKSDGVFVERKNAGWCGTPPITYADFEGTWTVVDSKIIITVAYWGGTADYQWKIISIDSKELKIAVLSQEHHFENQ